MGRHAVPVEEKVFRLQVEGRNVAVWTCTPARLEALAAGWLLSAGHVDDRADVRDVVVTDEPRLATIRVQLGGVSANRLAARLDHRADAACGPRHFLDCEPGRLHARDAMAPEAPDPSTAAALLRDMYGRAERYREQGGLHVAALFGSDGAAITWAEEVSRHNAVDKVIGGAWLDGVLLGQCGLLLSARVSAQIAVSAARAGLAWIASRSVPTTLALEVAAAAGIPIVARAAGDEARTFGGNT